MYTHYEHNIIIVNSLAYWVFVCLSVARTTWKEFFFGGFFLGGGGGEGGEGVYVLHKHI